MHPDRDSAERLDELRHLEDPRDVDARIVAIQRLERQDEFLETRVPRSFAEAIDAGVRNRDARLDRREAVRDRKTEVVVAVERQLRRLEALPQLPEEPRDPGRRHHADRVADDRAVRARLRAGVVQVHHEPEVRAERVLGDERHRNAVGDGVFRLPDRGLLDLFTGHRELVLDVQVGPRGEERDLVDVAREARIDVLPDRPGRAHDRRLEPRARDHPDGARFFLRDDRDPDVDDREVNLIQEGRNPQFLLGRIRDPGRLLAVPQRLLPDPDAFRDEGREAGFDEVVVDQRFFWNLRSPA